MNVLNQAALFLIRVLFNLYLFILLARILLQWAGANYYNPIIQLIVRLTDPIILPLRRLIPSHFGIDFAAVILLVVIELIKLFLLTLLITNALPHFGVLMLWALVDICSLLINIFFYAIILAVIVSWLGPMLHNPFIEILHLLAEPLLRPARRIIPPIAGFDISPIPVLIVLKLIDNLLWQGFFSMVGGLYVS